MPEPALLLIGPFSRASFLSVKTLRAYHESGLLVPAVVDPQTGYRSYSTAQLTDAAVIVRLRALDVPLDAVRQILDARDPETTRKVLQEHGAVLESRLASTQRAIDDLYVALDAPASHTPVHVRHEAARSVLTVQATVRDAETFLLGAAELLDDAVRASGAVATGIFGATFPPEVEDEAEEDVVAFIPVDRPPLVGESHRAAGVRVGELPATDVAVIVHHGGFDTMIDTYRNLGAWVASHAEPAGLAVREYYLDETTTEICWPVN